jgi:hypothetical protein
LLNVSRGPASAGLFFCAGPARAVPETPAASLIWVTLVTHFCARLWYYFVPDLPHWPASDLVHAATGIHAFLAGAGAAAAPSALSRLAARAQPLDQVRGTRAFIHHPTAPDEVIE